MNDTLAITLITSGIVYGTPLLIAGLGKLLTERSGVLNLGIEGMMLIGGVSGFWAPRGPAARHGAQSSWRCSSP
jgi:simple sugar transport system permease protein